MLQKPNSKSKARDHAKFLEARLKLWSEGKIDQLLAEGREIQKRLSNKQKKREKNRDKSFCQLMLLGKVSQAMKYINNEDQARGIHTLNDTIKELLQEKHPKGRIAEEDILLPTTSSTAHPVIYEEITADKVQTAALNLHGSGGPTLVDADGWKHMLCSKAYGHASINLCQAVADLTKKLCREAVHPESLEEYVACRLVPLDKGEDKFGNPGVRPIGIGEILRRLVGKVLMGCIRKDIYHSCRWPIANMLYESSFI